jgi:hypothetical protein
MNRRNPFMLMLVAAAAGIANLFNSGGAGRITRHDPGKHAGGYTPPPRMRSRRPMSRYGRGTPRVRPPTGRHQLLARLATGGRHPCSYPPKHAPDGYDTPGICRKRIQREEAAGIARVVHNAHRMCRLPRKHAQASAPSYRSRGRWMGWLP